MLINKIKILFLIFLIMILNACDKKLNFNNEKAVLLLLTYNGFATSLDSVVKLEFEIFNKSDTCIFIPITSWLYDGKRDSSGGFSRPEKPYFLNTLHYYPIWSNLNDAIFDINMFSFYNKWPFLCKIDPNTRKSFRFLLSKYYYDNHLNVDDYTRIKPRFKNTQSYTILISLPIFTKSNFLKIVDEQFEYESLIKDSIDIVFPVLKYTEPKFKFIESGFDLSRKDCEYLNLLSENRLIIKFDINP